MTNFLILYPCFMVVESGDSTYTTFKSILIYLFLSVAICGCLSI